MNDANSTESCVFKVNNFAEVETAILACEHFANGRRGSWTALPFHRFPKDDYIPITGYVGFTTKQKDRLTAEKVRKIMSQSTLT